MSVSIESIEERLRRVPEGELELVYDFVSFLADANTPDQPSEPDPFPPLAMFLRVVLGAAMLSEYEVPRVVEPFRGLRKRIPLIGQEQSNWCWAATTQTIMSYHGENVEQARLAADYADGENKARWPPFEEEGFSEEIRWGGETLGEEEVKTEIDADRPFAISWEYIDGGSHIIVVTGYLQVGDELWLVVHDSWPPGKDGSGGDRALISYDHYVNGLAGTREESLRTLFGLRPISHTTRATS